MKLACRWHARPGLVLATLPAVQVLGGVVLLWMQPLPAPRHPPAAVGEWARAVDPLHVGWLPGQPGLAWAVVARVVWTLLALAVVALALAGAVQRLQAMSKSRTPPSRPLDRQQDQLH